MKSNMRAALAMLVILLAAGLGGSCKKNGETTEPGQPAAAQAWLKLIPADSPLVMTNLRPVPSELVDWMAKGLAPLGQMIETEIQKELDKTQDKQERAVLTEIQGKLSSREGLRSIGVSLEPRFAIYGIGPSLAMRVELADGKRMADFLDRLETASGASIDKATFEDVAYRSVTEDDASFVFAIHGNEAVLGIMHANARAHVLPVLFGKKAPDASLADNRAIEALVEKYGLLGVGTGYIDIEAAVRMFTGRASALSNTILAASGIELPPLSSTCHAELDQMAAAAPRIAFGYRALSSKGFDALGVWEMRGDLAKELAALRAPVPGVSGFRTDKPLFAMAVGLDLDKAMAWARGKAAAMLQSPYQCEVLGELNQAVAEIASGLEQELPPQLAGFEGGLVALTSFAMGGFMPTGTGYAAFGVSDPMALVDMARAAIPQLAEAEITPDGKPTAIPTGMPGLDTVHLTVQGSWLGAAVGPGIADRLVGLLREKPAADSPLFLMAYNYQQFMEIMEQTGAFAQSSQEERLLIESIGRLFGYVEASFSFDERGLVMSQRGEFF